MNLLSRLLAIKNVVIVEMFKVVFDNTQFSHITYAHTNRMFKGK